MKRAAITTAWTGTGSSTEDAQRPALSDVYSLGSWTDITGQPAENLHPDPNAFTVEIMCEDAVLAQMDADGVPILWSEDA